MQLPMMSTAQSDQILQRVCAAMCSRYHVMNLRPLGAATIGPIRHTLAATTTITKMYLMQNLRGDRSPAPGRVGCMGFA